MITQCDHEGGSGTFLSPIVLSSTVVSRIVRGRCKLHGFVLRYDDYLRRRCVLPHLMNDYALIERTQRLSMYGKEKRGGVSAFLSFDCIGYSHRTLFMI